MKTANFIVRGSEGAGGLPQLAERCESLRATLQKKWLGISNAETWSPPCAIVLHATRASYLCEVGRQGSQTTGASRVSVRAGRICGRRIDLLDDCDGQSSDALAHELTHVVLADRFPMCPPPPWADEGMAVLADSPQKQNRHRRDLESALRKDGAFSVNELWSVTSCPSGQQRATFYGQSVSLVRFLTKRHAPEQFVVFLRRAAEIGHDRALKEVYEIDGAAELDRLWRQQAELEMDPASQFSLAGSAAQADSTVTAVSAASTPEAVLPPGPTD